VDQRPVPPTVRAFSYDNSFVKEPQQSLIPLYPFALRNKVLPVPALAHGLLFPQTLPVLSGEAEDPFRVATLKAAAKYHTFEITFPRTGMMLDGQLKGNQPASLAPIESKAVIVARVAVGINAASGKCFQIGERNLRFHGLPPGNQPDSGGVRPARRLDPRPGE
jgi:hypothetical protein